MSNMYIKDTWGDADAFTNVHLYGDSIAGYYSYQDRFDGWFFQLIKHYKDRGFNIKGHDSSINGGVLYHNRPSTYVVPAYVTGGRPSRINGFNIDDAVADGATDVIIAQTSNDVTLGHTDPNPAGLNSATDEQNDLYTAIQAVCDANNITLHILTQNTTVGNQGITDIFKGITDELVALNEHNYIDNFYTLADPDNGYLAKAGYYKNDFHPNEVGNQAVFDVVLSSIDNHYGLLADVATLVSDTPCADNKLIINKVTNIATQNNKTGSFLINKV